MLACCICVAQLSLYFCKLHLIPFDHTIPLHTSPPLPDCHILLSTDQSISRNHAKLTVSSPPTTGGATPTVLPPTVTLTDLSKFGTRVNGCKVERTGSGLAVVELKNGEEVKFGGTPASTVFRYTLHLSTQVASRNVYSNQSCGTNFLVRR